MANQILSTVNYDNLIFHIPHSSLYIPKNIFKDDDSELFLENIISQTDVFTDILFDFKHLNMLNVKMFNFIFPYNRFYCDVERYWNDEDEYMSEIGQGVYYTKFKNGDDIVRYDNKSSIKYIYHEHHSKIIDTINSFNRKDKTLLIDCHSFNDDVGMPDICIGLNNNQYDVNNKTLNYIIDYFKKHNLIVKINYPYTGSLIPNNIYNNIETIMLEINKKTYLNNNYTHIKNILDNLILNLKYHN